MKNLLLLFFFFNVPGAYSQESIDTVQQAPATDKEPFFHRSHNFHIGCERMPVIIGELRIGQNAMAAGGGIAISGGNSGCMGGANSGIGVSCLYEWESKTKIPSIDAWVHSYLAVMGLTLRIKAQYLINDNYRTGAFQPQIGLGFIRMHLMYGYNFYLRKPDGVNLVSHCFTGWFNIPTMEDKAERLIRINQF
ncbi:MAG TPA: hypothetical protein VK177_09130 [Flavobacteriales bacterium]|nr:hypothetical protein [Flavobacteriales bacterium]